MVTTNNVSQSTAKSFEALQEAANKAANKTQSDSEKASSDYESFLQLMTTQMKNQDPLKPMDSTQFVSQLAQFSGVEQQVNMNKKLEELIKSVSGGQFDEAALYLGKNITAPTGKFEVTDTNIPELSYKTPDDAVSANIVISDKTGRLVDTIPITPSLTEKTISWDKMGLDDIMVGNGTYLAKIVSTNSAGTQTTENALTKNKVTEVIRTDVGYDLKTNFGDVLGLDKVTALSND